MKINIRRHTKVRIYRAAAWALLVIVVLLLAGCFAFAGLQISGRKSLGSVSEGSSPMLNLAGATGRIENPEAAGLGEAPETGEDWQEGDVRYQGVHYRYNEDILTFLFMGIDKESEVKPVENGMDGGQSDAMFLLVMNPHSKELSIISIPRDTMTDIDGYDENGYFVATIKAQLALQHGYGDGAELSCERTKRAVARLFYELPIHGYCAVNMGAVPLLNDAVGGVEIVAPEDVIYTDIKEGDRVLLKGEAAYNYLHNRDTSVPWSAVGRLERQKQYLAAYAAAAKEAMGKDITLPVTLYNTLSKYMVTDISLNEVSYLAMQASGYHFDENNMYSLEGENVRGEQYEEFYVDEAALYELILRIFYEEVE